MGNTEEKLFLLWVLVSLMAFCICNNNDTDEISTDGQGTKCNLSIHEGNEPGAKCFSKSMKLVQSILPLDIENLQVYKTPTMVLPSKGFARLAKLKKLDLRNNKIRYITSSAFYNLSRLAELNLDGNRIKVLGRMSFRYVPNLRILILSRNFLRRFIHVSQAISILPKIEELILDENKLIEFIKKDDMLPLTKINLKILKLRYCLLFYVHSEAFMNVGHSLKELYIDGNFMIPKEALSNMTHGLRGSSLKLFSAMSCRLKDVPITSLWHLQETGLKKLALSFNMFSSSIEIRRQLPRLEHLEILEMMKCDMMSFNANLQELFPNLKHLYVQRNSFSYLPKVISTMRQLVTLQLQQQQLSNEMNFIIPEKAFINLSHLKYLHLQNNRIREIRNTTFVGLSSVETLELDFCGIMLIKENSFSTLKNLKRLFLSGNSFSFKESSFRGLVNLETLSLRHSVTVRIGLINPFRDSTKLWKLDLTENGITNYDLDILQPLKRLKLLMLSYNKISSWHVRLDIFNKSRNLKYVSLNNNNIKTLTAEMIQDFNNLEELRIVPNPIDCDLCETLLFQNWLRDINNNLTNVSLIYGHLTRSVNCTRPNALLGKEVINLPLPLDHCIIKEPDLLLIVSITGIGCFVMGATLAWLTYFFRWYLRYWAFRIRVRVKRYREYADSKNYKYDAFVSYSHDDIDWVSKSLIPKVETNESKLKLCIHERDFEVGHIISENIFSAIDGSRKTIIVLSDNYLLSRWCMFEVHMTQHKLFDDSRDSLIIIELQKPSKHLMDSNMKYLCRTRTYLEWTNDPKGQMYFWERLKHSISKPMDPLQLQQLT